MKERFFQYGDVSGDKRAEAISGQVWEFLEDCACTNKVIAQCYDGTAVMAPGLKGVQAKIKEIIPQALFVHCYAHSLNLVMSPRSLPHTEKTSPALSFRALLKTTGFTLTSPGSRLN